MLLRQVQARPLQGHHLRALRRRGDPPEGAPRAHGPHRPGRARQPHLVLQGRPLADRLPARHRSQGAREGAVLRRLDRHLGGQGGARQGRARARGQGRPGEGAHRARQGRAAGRAGDAHAAPPPALHRRGDQGLRRGRRVLGAHAQQLGRGAGPAAARRGPRRWPAGCWPRSSKRIAGEDPKKVRELVRESAVRDDRKLASKELDNVAAWAATARELLAAELEAIEEAKGPEKTKAKNAVKARMAWLAGEDVDPQGARPGSGSRSWSRTAPAPLRRSRRRASWAPACCARSWSRARASIPRSCGRRRTTCACAPTAR